MADLTTEKAKAKSSLSKVKRVPKRGHYDAATINAILDEAKTAHVGFVTPPFAAKVQPAEAKSDSETVASASLGQPLVIPMLFARDGNVIYLHGSVSSRLLKICAARQPICVTVTHEDGLVLARSIFHHSMNYRSVVVFGTPREITGEEEKTRALRALSERLVPGRWDAVRPPNAAELKATKVLALEISEASAKVRTGPPNDDAADIKDPTWGSVWSGVVQSRLVYSDPIADKDTPVNTAVPQHVSSLSTPAAAAAKG